MPKKIVELKAGKIRGMVDVLFDDQSTISVNRRLIEKAGLRLYSEIDIRSLDKIIKEDDADRCYEAALNYLEYRPRSEAEVKQHLLYKRRFQGESVTSAIARLKKLNLIDDRAFAENWTRDRNAYRPKSRLMIKRELLQKGVGYDIADEATQGVEDEAGAYKAGLKKAKLLKQFDYPQFAKRLAAFLARRGYAVDAVNSVTMRLWHEITGEKTEK
ncbi:MAG: regulatory protein RecX [Dehalococcoidia bacterium]|jgi:regulatory protein